MDQDGTRVSLFDALRHACLVSHDGAHHIGEHRARFGLAVRASGRCVCDAAICGRGVPYRHGAQSNVVPPREIDCPLQCLPRIRRTVDPDHSRRVLHSAPSCRPVRVAPSVSPSTNKSVTPSPYPFHGEIDGPSVFRGQTHRRRDHLDREIIALREWPLSSFPRIDGGNEVLPAPEVEYSLLVPSHGGVHTLRGNSFLIDRFVREWVSLHVVFRCLSQRGAIGGSSAGLYDGVGGGQAPRDPSLSARRRPLT